MKSLMDIIEYVDDLSLKQNYALYAAITGLCIPAFVIIVYITWFSTVVVTTASGAILTGSCIAIVLYLWCVFDLYFFGKLQERNEKKSTASREVSPVVNTRAHTRFYIAELMGAWSERILCCS